MILIGQYDSPFVRRVAIALRLYGLPFEHQPWSTFGDAEKIAPFNPLRRVPTLLLDGGEALIESTAILDYLDELCSKRCKKSVSRWRRRTGSGQASATPTSRSPACCASPARRIPRCSARRAIRRYQRMP
jgi:glutathione S-transferase